MIESGLGKRLPIRKISLHCRAWIYQKSPIGRVCTIIAQLFNPLTHIMEELKNLNRADLIDQLAEYTARFSRLFSEKKKDDAYYHTKQMIKLLTEELEVRENLETIKTFS